MPAIDDRKTHRDHLPPRFTHRATTANQGATPYPDRERLIEADERITRGSDLFRNASDEDALAPVCSRTGSQPSRVPTAVAYAAI
jgi:hypothetical protein